VVGAVECDNPENHYASMKSQQPSNSLTRWRTTPHYAPSEMSSVQMGCLKKAVNAHYVWARENEMNYHIEDIAAFDNDNGSGYRRVVFHYETHLKSISVNVHIPL
jgi:hypothetical protein